MLDALFINLNYTCNEHCVFCAADITFELKRRRRGITFDQIRAWVESRLPGYNDHVMLAGGEPTLHPEFHEIIRFFASYGSKVIVFTNGLRLADRTFASRTVEAGVRCFEIALFGATAEQHDRITGLRGSFDKAITAFQELGKLKTREKFELVLRLLFSRQTASENPDIVRMASLRLPWVDTVSLNRLILSQSAFLSNSAISWAEARNAVNQTVRLARHHGYSVSGSEIPLCVFDIDNRRTVMAVLPHPKDISDRWAVTKIHYLDVGVIEEQSVRSLPVHQYLPDVCSCCDFKSLCGGIEKWYFDLYGTSGLSACTVAESYGSDDSAETKPQVVTQSTV